MGSLHADVLEANAASQVEPGYLRKLLPASAPDDPESLDAILRDVRDLIVPGITHWQSPSFFAYFQCCGSTAGFLGEMLSTGFNVVGFNWVSSPAATELESIVMDWLGSTLALPKPFLFSGGGGGVLQGTTCEAILCTLAAARDRTLRRIGRDGIGKLVVYGSDQTHCGLQKAAQIAGIHPANFRAVETYKEDHFGLSPEALRRAVDADEAAGLVPFFLCATRVHLPRVPGFIDGVEGADSFSFNAHKWLFTTLDCCCLWVKDPDALVRALSTNPEYLRNRATESKSVVDYKDWQIALSRRFRALKLWMVLRSYGVANLRNFLRGHVGMAKDFEAMVAADCRFEVVVPRYFAMVCFRLLPPDGAGGGEERAANEINRRLLEAVNASGKVYVTHAVVGGVYLIRFAVGTTLTEEWHVRAAWKVVVEHAEELLKEL
uniref:Uncharacterized protein n=1 Tax=Ananas comosus var. bracteatus TaxID=296719 RepID=A0A6V7NSH3_ANACO|nr:unnamed protein product [Ananas comosus var. bracteatus]